MRTYYFVAFIVCLLLLLLNGWKVIQISIYSRHRRCHHRLFIMFVPIYSSIHLRNGWKKVIHFSLVSCVLLCFGRIVRYIIWSAHDRQWATKGEWRNGINRNELPNGKTIVEYLFIHSTPCSRCSCHQRAPRPFIHWSSQSFRSDTHSDMPSHLWHSVGQREMTSFSVFICYTFIECQSAHSNEPNKIRVKFLLPFQKHFNVVIRKMKTKKVWKGFCVLFHVSSYLCVSLMYDVNQTIYFNSLFIRARSSDNIISP